MVFLCDLLVINKGSRLRSLTEKNGGSAVIALHLGKWKRCFLLVEQGGGGIPQPFCAVRGWLHMGGEIGGGRYLQRDVLGKSLPQKANEGTGKHST